MWQAEQIIADQKKLLANVHYWNVSTYLSSVYFFSALFLSFPACFRERHGNITSFETGVVRSTSLSSLLLMKKFYTYIHLYRKSITYKIYIVNSGYKQWKGKVEENVYIFIHFLLNTTTSTLLCVRWNTVFVFTILLWYSVLLVLLVQWSGSDFSE